MLTYNIIGENMKKTRTKTIDSKLNQLGQMLDLRTNDVAMAKLRLQTMIGMLIITGIVTLLSRLLCTQLDPSGLYYLVPQQSSHGLLSRFF